MATSSITHNFTIISRDKAEAFINALEEAEKVANDYTSVKSVTVRQLTDPEEINALWSKKNEVNE